MTKWHYTAIAVFAVAILVAFAVPLFYSQASVLFAVLALGFAYPLVHKTDSASVAGVSLAVMAIVVSFFPKKLFQVEGFVTETIATLVVGAVLFAAGQGWKRKWS